MSNCNFCGRRLNTGNRDDDDTNEHVLKREWIVALGHEHTGMPGTVTRGSEVLRSIPDSRGPLQLVTGKICRRCNEGWMDRLDNSIGDEFLALARGERSLDALDAEARLKLARWALKTTCVLRYEGPQGTRHLNEGLMRSVEIPRYVPRGFIAFATLLEPGTRGLRASSMDRWVQFDGQSSGFLHLPQSHRMKAAFQYDRLLVGCAWVNSYGMPEFSAVPGLHNVLYVNAAKTIAHPDRHMDWVVDMAENEANFTHAIQSALSCRIVQE